jgi:hypothetical protein
MQSVHHSTLHPLRWSNGDSRHNGSQYCSSLCWLSPGCVRAEVGMPYARLRRCAAASAAVLGPLQSDHHHRPSGPFTTPVVTGGGVLSDNWECGRGGVWPRDRFRLEAMRRCQRLTLPLSSDTEPRLRRPDWRSADGVMLLRGPRLGRAVAISWRQRRGGGA